MCCAAKQYSNVTYSRLDGTLISHVYTHSYTQYKVNSFKKLNYRMMITKYKPLGIQTNKKKKQEVINKDGIQSKTDLRKLNNIHITANYGPLLKRFASWK